MPAIDRGPPGFLVTNLDGSVKLNVGGTTEAGIEEE